MLLKLFSFPTLIDVISFLSVLLPWNNSELLNSFLFKANSIPIYHLFSGQSIQQLPPWYSNSLQYYFIPLGRIQRCSSKPYQAYFPLHSTTYQSRMGGQRHCGVTCLPKTSTHSYQSESNTTYLSYSFISCSHIQTRGDLIEVLERAFILAVSDMWGSVIIIIDE